MLAHHTIARQQEDLALCADEASVGRRLQARELKSGTFYVFSVLHDPLEGACSAHHLVIHQCHGSLYELSLSTSAPLDPERLHLIADLCYRACPDFC